LCSSLRISGHLPDPIVNGGGDRFWKWKEFKLSTARDLDLGSGHTAYRRASLIDLYLYTKFHWNRRNFLWTDGRTDIFPPSNIIRSTFESRPKNYSSVLSAKHMYQLRKREHIKTFWSFVWHLTRPTTHLGQWDHINAIKRSVVFRL